MYSFMIFLCSLMAVIGIAILFTEDSVLIKFPMFVFIELLALIFMSLLINTCGVVV